MRWFKALLGAALAAAVALGAHAAQNATITFDVPSTGGAPTGYRVYRDGTLVGAVTSGQTLTALFPNDTGTYTIGVEAFNATGAGPRVNKSVVLALAAPGPVRNLVITCPVPATPATVTCTVTDAP